MSISLEGRPFYQFGVEGGPTASFFWHMKRIARDYPELPMLMLQDNHWWENQTFSDHPNLYKIALDDTVTPTSITVDPEAAGGVANVFRYDRRCWCTDGHRPTSVVDWPSNDPRCGGACDTNRQCANENPCGSYGTGGCRAR